MSLTNISYEGYVLYGKGHRKPAPFGIISSDYKRKAMLSHVPSKMQKYLIEVEDRRFYKHSGLDYKGIARAIATNIKHGRMLQGGSTITQQLARNLMEDNGKTLSRKIKESVYAIQLEKKYVKDCIINMYFDNVFWGNNVYGLRAASLSYFKKEPYALSEQEVILLITLLRGPNLYLKNEDQLYQRYVLLNNLLLDRNILSKRHYDRNIKHWPVIQYQKLDSIKSSVISYIADYVDTKNRKISTTIDVRLQKVIEDYVSTSKRPVSVLVFSKDVLCAIKSSYGHEYPLTYKSNVGSTLKPFLYVFLRENGIAEDDLFSTFENPFESIREGNAPQKPYYTLNEGLLESNNNVFINAAHKVGLNKTYDYLACLLNKDRDEISLSTILGSTSTGLSLFELGQLYSKFLGYENSRYKEECLNVLNLNACRKWSSDTEFFLKTGTTNDNRECFLIAGNKDLILCFLEHGDVSAYFKGMSLTESTKRLLCRKDKNLYKWMD